MIKQKKINEEKMKRYEEMKAQGHKQPLNKEWLDKLGVALNPNCDDDDVVFEKGQEIDMDMFPPDRKPYFESKR